MAKRLLLLSNSTNSGEAYLGWPLEHIKGFLGSSVKEVLFIPYAAAGFSYDEYEQKVKEAFSSIGQNVKSIHHFANPRQAVMEAEAVAVGGGNTFRLLQLLQEQSLVDAIQEKTEAGMPYIGWSAGSNVATPSLKTTNDMPIAQPQSFNALNLVGFQINPHYTNKTIPNHGGESRDQRLAEYLALNPESKVLGVEEGALVRVENNEARLEGENGAVLFAYNEEPKHIAANSDISNWVPIR